MRVFIAGATGVLGRRVVSLLSRAGHQPVGLSRSSSNDQIIRQNGGEPRSGDLFNAAELNELSADCQAIVHLATAIPRKSRPTPRDWLLNDRIRREGTSNLLEAAVKNRCTIYLQQSVALLYGDRRGEWVDEQSELPARQPSMLTSAVDMENLVLEAVRQRKCPAHILRFGTFYAHDAAQTSSMFESIQQKKFPVIGDGNGYWNMVNVDDAAAAILCCITATNLTPGNVYNICDDEPVRSRELVSYIAEILGASRPRRIPVFLAKMALAPDLVSILRSSVRCDNRKAKKELGWQPGFPTFREGFNAEIATWKGNH